MHKKNLLIVTSTFPRWKKDTDPPFVFELAKRLTDAFNITVLAPNYPGAKQDEFMEGINVHRFRYFLCNFEILAGSDGILPSLKKNKYLYLLIPLFILFEFLTLLKLIKKTKPDVIHAHWILPQGFVAALAKKITGVPYIVTAHGSDIYGIQGNLFKALKGYALHNAAHVTVVSKDIQQTIKQKFGKELPTKVISMGVDSQLFHPDRRNLTIRKKYNISGPFLLYVGRLSEVKGVRYLIESMPKILKHFAESKLLIIGKGELQQELIRLTDSLGLLERVIFAGAIPNSEIPQFLATADIFIGPSIHAEGGEKEGFGLTLVEAAMSGCIVITSNVGGVTDIIENAKTGFVAKEKDSEALADLICNVLNQFDSLSDIRLNARQKMVSQFDWQVIAGKYQKILSNNQI